MSVTAYVKDNKTYFKVYVHLRSKTHKKLRLQKFRSGFQSEKKAKLEESRIVKELALELARLEGKGPLWEELLTQWFYESCDLSFLTSESVTLRDHFSRLKKYTSHWNESFASEISRSDCIDVLNEAKKNGANNTLLRKLRSSINAVFNWAIERKLVHQVVSPLTSVKISKEKGKSARQVLSFEEMRRLLLEAKKANHPWYHIWAFALLTGMRSGELYALRWTDIDFEKKIIRVERSFNRRISKEASTKTGEWRTVPISSELLSVMEEIPKPSQEDFVLPRIKEWENGQASIVLKNFLVSLSIHKEIVFHSLRACFATHLLSFGADPAKIMKIGGWSDLSTFQIYVRLSGIVEAGVTENLRIIPRENLTGCNP